MQGEYYKVLRKFSGDHVASFHAENEEELKEAARAVIYYYKLKDFVAKQEEYLETLLSTSRWPEEDVLAKEEIEATLPNDKEELRELEQECVGRIKALLH